MKAFFSSYVLALNKLSYEKHTHKTLMKSTPERERKQNGEKLEMVISKI